MAVPEWLKTPRNVLLVTVPVVGLGLGGTFYFLKKRQQIVTVTVDQAVATLCKTWITITVTITDGFGNPCPNETFTLRIYLEATLVEERTLTTGPDGTWVSKVCWHAPEAPSQHVDTETRLTVTYTAEAPRAKGSATHVIVVPACTNLPCTCA